LKELWKNRRALETILNARAIVDECLEIIQSYEKNVVWSEQNYNYEYIVSVEESLVDIKSSLLKRLYVASSFVIPLSSKSYRRDFEQIRREFYTYKTSLEVFENLERDVRDSQKAQLRSMETIAIFTSIVTFIAASIPTFKFIDTPTQAAIFMLALACSLGFFVLLIVIVSRGIHKLKDHKWFVLTTLLVATSFWVLLIRNNSEHLNLKSKKSEEFEKRLENIENEMDIKTDSTLKR
jgi:hypothetical protein